MANPLRKIEVELENLFEKSTSVFSTHTVHAGKMLARMIEALEENAQTGPGGRWIAPNQFHLALGRRLYQTTQSVQDLRTLLTAKLEDHIRQSEMILLGPLEITFAEDSSLRPENVRVSAEIDRASAEATGGFEPVAIEPVALPPGAFLIINGQRHFPLNHPVINIGRHLENHLVLDDPLVSRRHAQLRARDGQYLLTDLGSKHGIRLNKQPAREGFLQPGDILQIGETELIYGDEREESITQPITPQKPDSPPAGETTSGQSGAGGAAR